LPGDLQHPDLGLLCAKLEEHRVEFLVMGGWAAIAHGLPRTTLDVDIFVRPSLDNAAKLVGALSEIGFGIAKEIDPQEIIDRRIFLFADQIRVDVFTKPVGLDDFDQCWSRRADREFDSVRIPFLGIDDLIRSKEKTGRPQDEEDVQALRKLRNAS
jgi:hypothetical protein